MSCNNCKNHLLCQKIDGETMCLFLKNFNNKMQELNYKKVYETIENGINMFIESNKLESLILGVSGGLDSTVLAALIHSSRIKVPLFGRSLTIKNSSLEYSSSLMTGKAFCNNFQEINLSEVYEKYKKFIFYREGIDSKIANGNIQARLRMIYLYNLASLKKGIVLSTDNRTEYELGFWTLHGDIGDLVPLSGLWKHEVYELAKYLRDNIYKHCPEQQQALDAAINLTPTDGLGISNSDFEQFGVDSYDIIDEILYGLIEDSDYLNTVVKSKYSLDLIDKIRIRHQNSEFKRTGNPSYISRLAYWNK